MTSAGLREGLRHRDALLSTDDGKPHEPWERSALPIDVSSHL